MNKQNTFKAYTGISEPLSHSLIMIKPNSTVMKLIWHN